MKEQVNTKFLNFAILLMNEEQINVFKNEIYLRMDELKTSLIENTKDENQTRITKEEYFILKDLSEAFTKCY